MLATLGFLVTIGILVVIHEYGHYLFARLFGVKVLCFSIGFGPKILKWQGRHNQWCISAIPLGGYVQMLDEREGPVAEELKGAAFNNKAPYQKLLIAFAGPLFNILFAFVAYYCIALYGVYNLKPVILSLNPTPLVQNLTQIAPETTIQAINGKSVYSWSEAEDAFSSSLKIAPKLTLQLQHGGQESQLSLNLTKFIANQDNPSLSTLGLYPFNYLMTIGYIEPQSAAAKAGLREGDQLLAVNGHDLKNWFQLVTIIRNSPDKKLVFKLQRLKRIISLEITPDASSDDNGQISGKIGIMPTLDNQTYAKNSIIRQYGPISAIGYAAAACLNLAKNNLTMLNYMLNGQLSWHNLGGPVTIAKASQVALRQGVKSFVDFLALISLSLAVMNLLPIPVLDGGHMLLYGIEWLIGKPLSKPTQQLFFKTGLMIILAVTCLALYNDFLKLINL